MVQDARIKWIDRARRLPTWESTDAALVISSSDAETQKVKTFRLAELHAQKLSGRSA